MFNGHNKIRKYRNLIRNSISKLISITTANKLNKNSDDDSSKVVNKIPFKEGRNKIEDPKCPIDLTDIALLVIHQTSNQYLKTYVITLNLW